MNPKVPKTALQFAKFNGYRGRYVWNGGADRPLIHRTFTINVLKEACRRLCSEQSGFPGIETGFRCGAYDVLLEHILRAQNDLRFWKDGLESLQRSSSECLAGPHPVVPACWNLQGIGKASVIYLNRLIDKASL